MISPSWREVSPTEQLYRSPRLVPPRFRVVAAESRPERLLYIFSHRKTSYRRWASESHQGAHEVGGRAQGGRPHPREQGVAPLAFIFGVDFSLFISRYSVEFQDFWSCVE